MKSVLHSIQDWDQAYSNQGYVPHALALMETNAASAAAYRAVLLAEGRAELGLRYGPGARNTLDLFLPQGGQAAAKGLVVFVHGGYWRAFDPSYWSHLAQGAVDSGWAVAMPGYTLAPEVRIRDIGQEVAAAVNLAAQQVAGPIRLTGHSAGGHLVARLMCEDSDLEPAVAERVDLCLPISGLPDLRPLLRLELNNDLHLDAEEAAAESPALLEPRAFARLVCWVGGGELDEFCRQNALLANIWAGLGIETLCVEEANLNHFNVIDGLQQADSPLVQELLRLH